MASASCSVADPNKKEYKNWLTVGRAILTTQKGVAPLIQSHIERWHQSLQLIPRLSNCGPCICTGMTSTNCIPCRCTKKSRKSCGSCVCTFSTAPPKCPFCDAWKAELGSLRHHGAIIYDNAWKNCVWKDFDKLPWEVAKLFMAPLGSRKSDVKDAASTDLGSLMNLLERCPFIVPPVLRSAVCDVRDKVRNIWAHAANLEISDVDVNNAEQFLRVLLSDRVFRGDADSQGADKELQKLFKDSLICLPNTEFQVLKHLMVVLGEDQKSQNEKMNNLEETTSHIKSGLEKRMKEVEVKAVEYEEALREAKEDLTGHSGRLSKVEVKAVENEDVLGKVKVKTVEHGEALRNLSGSLSEAKGDLAGQCGRLSKSFILAIIRTMLPSMIGDHVQEI